MAPITFIVWVLAAAALPPSAAVKPQASVQPASVQTAPRPSTTTASRPPAPVQSPAACTPSARRTDRCPA